MKWAKALRVIDVFATIALFWVGYQIYLDVTHVPLDPADYMVINVVEVESGDQGADLPVIYDRNIEVAFWATWSVKIKPVGENGNACIGTNRHFYEPQDVVSEVTLSWYVEKECNLQPGDYTMTTVWSLDNGIEIHKTSNVFTVYEPGRAMVERQNRGWRA